jgi:nucleoside-diphosphate-sugar epimerase
MKRILVTGAAGFIGRSICRQLASENEVVAADTAMKPYGVPNIIWQRVDLTHGNTVAVICEKYSPDVVIHCAGIAHQTIGVIDSATYMRVNSEVTENLAKAAAKSNPDVCFVFLSSVSVYGEHLQITSCKSTKMPRRKDDNGVDEDSDCHPSSDYAVSKLDAERRLVALSDGGNLYNLLILRLAPVYDRKWSLNLDRRIFAPRKMAYLKFGSGLQRMSALARPNLVEFVAYILEDFDKNRPDFHLRGNGRKRDLRVFNVCDAEPYEFNTIIQVFRKSDIHPNRPVLSVPLVCIWLLTRIVGVFFSSKREWIYSCYDKLASDLVFDNGRMMATGFRPMHCLGTLFGPQIKRKF